MSEIEREEFKRTIEAMSLEEKKQAIALMPSELLFEELIFRERASREVLDKVKTLIA